MQADICLDGSLRCRRSHVSTEFCGDERGGRGEQLPTIQLVVH